MKITKHTLKVLFLLFVIHQGQIYSQVLNNGNDLSVSVDNKSNTNHWKKWHFNQVNINNPDSTEKKSKKVKISGVIQVHYLNELNTNGKGSKSPDGFRILRARLEASGKVNRYISYDLMIDPRAPEPRGILRDAYIGLHIIKNQTIRIGQQKTQFGWENRQSITELYTVNRAEMSDGVSRGENLRDIGIGLLGHIKINKHYNFENAITFTNGTRSNIATPDEFNSKKALWGRIGIRYKRNDLIARIGTSFGYGGLRYLNDDILDPSDDIYVQFKRWGTDVQIENNHFFAASEFALGTDMVSDTLLNEPLGFQILGALKTKWKIGPLIRYDAFEDEYKNITIGAYYGNPKDRFRILINYLVRGMIKEDNPAGRDDRLYVQMQVSF